MSENEWSPIETVPKNGTKILVSDGTEVDSVYWDYDMWCTPHGGNNIQYEPSHWCDLPIPIPRTQLEKLNAQLMETNKKLITENINLITHIKELSKKKFLLAIQLNEAILELDEAMERNDPKT